MNNKGKKYLYTIIISIISLVSIWPFYYMFIMGTYSENELFASINILPGTHLLDNLKVIFSTSKFLLYNWNSFYVALITAIIAVLTSSFAGYAISKFEFKFKNGIFMAILATMMVPSQLGLIAYVLEMRVLHFTNTHLPLIAFFAAMPFGVFFMTSFMKDSIPTEVLESARIDGSGEIGIFFKIVTGFIKPALGSLFMLAFIWSWNNYLLPLVVINNPNLYTIPVGIMSFGAAYSKEYAIRILGLAMGTIPLLIFFSIFSKSFIAGISAGAVKG